MKLDVLAIAAHPDDTELCCAGTLASLIQKGYRVGVLDLTQGEMGTRGTPEGRILEAENAAKVLGLSVRENIGLPDCGLENIPAHREAIIKVVRKYQPDICFINAPADRHPDHRNAARLAEDALFYGGLRNLKTDDQQPWRPGHILHYMQHWPFDPTIVFDISDTLELKEKAILAFESQFNVSKDDSGPKTYVSGESFFEALRGKARHYGQMIGVEFGEPFLYYGGPIPAKDLNFL
ncbi:MAG: bacillithiol biosynthesis deacetylase BshB1, partial [Balneolales bacterium]